MLTQKNIAKKLGVSASLVSRALCGTASKIGASEKTVHRIRHEAKRLGYAPNAAALALRGGRSMMIAVVIKDFDDPFLGTITRELQGLANKKGFSLILTGFGKGASGPDISSLSRFNLDALIICGSDLRVDWIKPFLRKGLPCVQIGSGVSCCGLNRVEIDEDFGIEIILKYLLSLGHRNIAFIGDYTGSHMRRKKIFKNIYAKIFRAVRPFTISVPSGRCAGIQAMKMLLRKSQKRPFTSVVAADDIMAQEALRALYDSGLSVPSDVSLSGVDDIPSARLCIPSLTTVRAPVDVMVRKAFELVIEKSLTGDMARSLKIRPELVKRESCSKVRTL